MYEAFFGLQAKPFNMTPDPRYLYLSDSHEEALSALLYGIQEAKGLITLTGPVGVGKTTILFSFLEKIKNQTETVFFQGGIAKDRLTFLRDLSEQFGLSSNYSSISTITLATKAFIADKLKQGKRVVLLIDEAQDFGIEELSHLHYLNNLETTQTKLIQIILSGTEKLDNTLRHKELASLQQRVAIRSVLNPLSPEETVKYICHRLYIASNSINNPFTTGALWRIVHYSGGIPRIINVVCDNAMISSFALKTFSIEEENVIEAIKNIEGKDIDSVVSEVISRDEISALRRTLSQLLSQIPKESDPFVANQTAAPQEMGPPQDSESLSYESSRADSIYLKPVGREPLRPAMFRFSISLGPKGLFIAFLLLGIILGSSVAYYLLHRERPSDSKIVSSAQKKSEQAQPVGGDLMKRDEKEIIAEITPSRIKGKEIAKIAWEYYGHLDISLLSALRESNGQIQDWNKLDIADEIQLPEVPDNKKGAVDFYTVQILTRRSKDAILSVAERLFEDKIQNIFIIEDPLNQSGQRWIRLCIGVFEKKSNSLSLLKKMRGEGFEDAFSIRLMNKRLDQILYPEAISGSTDDNE